VKQSQQIDVQTTQLMTGGVDVDSEEVIISPLTTGL